MSTRDRVRPPRATTPFVPFTDWIPAASLHRATVSMEFSGPSPRAVYRVVYQTAATSPPSNSDWSPPERLDPGAQEPEDDSE